MIPVDVKNDFLIAASHRDADKVISALNQYPSLAKETGKVKNLLNDFGVYTTGNAMHHALIGRADQLDEFMDDRIVNIVAELIKCNCNVNFKNEEQLTPLHIICTETSIQFEMSKYNMLDTDERKYDIDYPTKEIKDARLNTIKQKIEANKIIKLKIAEQLLQAGATPSIPNKDGVLPIQLIIDEEFQIKMDALFKKYKPNYLAESQQAIKEQKFERDMLQAVMKRDHALIRTAVRGGASPDMLLNGVTLLAFALTRGDYETFSLLLELKANPDISNLSDLLLAKFNPQIFRELLRRGLNPNRNLPESEEANYATHFTKVYWHQFALTGNVEAIQILLENGYQLDLDTEVNARSILDLLQPNALKNDPFLQQEKTKMEEELKGQLLTYEVVKIIDRYPRYLRPQPNLGLTELRGVNELPPEIKPLILAFGDKAEEASKRYYQLVKEPSYKEIADLCKLFFSPLECMKGMLSGDCASHRQILNLIALNNQFGMMGRLYFSLTKK